MPSLRGILETSLYVEDLARSAAFWEGVIGLNRLVPADNRFVAYDAGDHSVPDVALRHDMHREGQHVR